MKKIFYLSVFLLIIIPFNVKATVTAGFSCDASKTDANNRAIKECFVTIDATDTSKFYGLKANFNLQEASLKSIDVVDSTKFKIINKTSTSFEIISENPITNVNKLRIVKAIFYIDSENCVINLVPTEWSKTPSCVIKGGYYYNKNGLSVSEKEYKADCGMLSCEKYNNKFYNKTGVAVSEAEYKADCGLYSCEIYNGNFYNKNGLSVSENEYKADCGKLSCEKYNDKFYNKSGVVVTEAEYKADCGLYNCEQVEDKYYNASGVSVSEKEYKKQCGKYSCEIVDDEYYNKLGKKVTKEVYEKECEPPKKETPKCKIENDKYYGSLGTEVTKEVYEKECPTENVKTGITSYSFVIVITIVVSGILYFVLRKHNYFN